MDDELSGFMVIRKYMETQEDKIDLALETIQQIATKAAIDAQLNKSTIPIKDIAEILEQFTSRWDEIC